MTRNIEDVVEQIMQLKGRFNLLRMHLENADTEQPKDI